MSGERSADGFAGACHCWHLVIVDVDVQALKEGMAVVPTSSPVRAGVGRAAGVEQAEQGRQFGPLVLAPAIEALQAALSRQELTCQPVLLLPSDVAGHGSFHRLVCPALPLPPDGGHRLCEPLALVVAGCPEVGRTAWQLVLQAERPERESSRSPPAARQRPRPAHGASRAGRTGCGRCGAPNRRRTRRGRRAGPASCRGAGARRGPVGKRDAGATGNSGWPV